MLHRIRVCLFSLCLVATPYAAAPNTPTPEDSDRAVREAVLATNAAMLAAANQLDTTTFFSYILDSSACPVAQNGVIFRTRQEAKDVVDRGLRGVAKIERRIDHPQVTVLGPDAALLVGDGTVTMTLDDGTDITGTFAVSLVFVRRNAAWKILHGHYSAPPRP